MARCSAGLLVYRRGVVASLEVLLVHPGGPLWAKKDEGAWSIPKGEFDAGELDAQAVARREFTEELGAEPPDGPWLPLGEVRQASGKRVVAWAVKGDLDATSVTSNTFEMEWPPRSGRMQAFPEVDRAGWFGIVDARARLVKGQLPLLDRLDQLVATGEGGTGGAGS